MKIVGDELESLALTTNDESKKDLFARSAFNRYYYAVFLLTREMLGEFEASWKKTMHASIPELLRTSVKKKVDRESERAARNGIMTKAQTSQLIQQHKTSLFELAELLESAYKVRLIADYEPEIAIQQNHKVLSLDGHNLTTVKDWPGRAASYCKAIRKVWKELGLA